MKYALHIENKNSYLHFRVEGDNTIETVRKYFAEVYHSCREQGMNLVLIEENLQGPNLDIYDVFDIVIHYIGKAQSFGLRLAFVDLNHEHDKRGVKFAQNLAQLNKVDVQVFFNTTEALAWLLKKGVSLHHQQSLKL
jgi:hypothetical protein